MSANMRRGASREASGRLTGKQALALWELIITGDAKTTAELHVALGLTDVKGLEGAGLITVERGSRAKGSGRAATLHVTEEGWDWASHEGFAAALAPTGAGPVLQALLGKVGDYLEVHGLALDHLLRPRGAGPDSGRAGSQPVEERPRPAHGEVGPAALPGDIAERIRAAYLRVTGGPLNKYVRLADLRAELGAEPREAVDAELRLMPERGGAVLYPIDDPRLIRPVDNVAALRVAGERRDLLCIKR